MALVAVLGLTIAAPKTVRAQTGAEVAAAVGAIKQAYSAYQSVKSLFDPSLADQLQSAVNQLTAYMKTARDQQWASAARSAASDMKSLSTHQPSDPTNQGLWNNIWYNLSTNGIDPMYQVLRSSTDGLSMYQTAPTLNELAASWIGLLLMKGQIWPGYPSTWRDYQGRSQQVADLNYYMVGAKGMFCYPGYDPGRGNYDLAHAPMKKIWLGITVPAASGSYNVYKNSQLWNYLASKYSGGTLQILQADCSAVKAVDITYGSGCNVSTTYDTGFFPRQTCYTYWWGKDRSSNLVLLSDDITTQCLAAGMAKFTAIFEADPVRQIISASQMSLLSLGGGDDGVSDTSTSLPLSGSFVDPWVNEPGMCANYSSKAYPIQDHMCGWLRSGETLKTNESVSSCDGRFHLVMQGDGNLVLYQGVSGQTMTPLWYTSTYGSNFFAVMQTDGNFVLYNASYTPLWSSGTWTYPGATFAVQNDGNLVVYSNTTPLWASGTAGH